MPGLMPITNTELFLDAILKRLDAIGQKQEAIYQELVAQGKAKLPIHKITVPEGSPLKRRKK